MSSSQNWEKSIYRGGTPAKNLERLKGVVCEKEFQAQRHMWKHEI